jgi:hypothetical protein
VFLCRCRLDNITFKRGLSYEDSSMRLEDSRRGIDLARPACRIA